MALAAATGLLASWQVSAELNTHQWAAVQGCEQYSTSGSIGFLL